MSLRIWIASTALLFSVAGTGGALAAWKEAASEEARAAAAAQPEPAETVTAAVAGMRDHRRSTTSIGTVVALRSVTLRNELPGTVREVHRDAGTVVAAGTVLVALDVSVEEAELRGAEARADLAETLLGRVQRASENNGASAADVDRARAELAVARADVERLRAVIERKTIRAPFEARVGLSDVHPGQFLDAGTELTTLQGVDEAVHVDFAVPQGVGADLRVGGRVTVTATRGDAPVPARVVAVDARVDRATRNAGVRARIEDAGRALAPGSSVRVEVPVGEASRAVVVPVRALRKGPAGDHVFVLDRSNEGEVRARVRNVESGPVLGDEVIVASGLAAGEEVATSGSFKLYEGALVAIAPATVTLADASR